MQHACAWLLIPTLYPAKIYLLKGKKGKDESQEMSKRSMDCMQDAQSASTEYTSWNVYVCQKHGLPSARRTDNVK